jgi:hypothetical protein
MTKTSTIRIKAAGEALQEFAPSRLPNATFHLQSSAIRTARHSVEDLGRRHDQWVFVQRLGDWEAVERIRVAQGRLAGPQLRGEPVP